MQQNRSFENALFIPIKNKSEDVNSTEPNEVLPLPASSTNPETQAASACITSTKVHNKETKKHWLINRQAQEHIFHQFVCAWINKANPHRYLSLDMNDAAFKSSTSRICIQSGKASNSRGPSDRAVLHSHLKSPRFLTFNHCVLSPLTIPSEGFEPGASAKKWA